MYEWGRANRQHDKSIHRGLYVCVWRELGLMFFHAQCCCSKPPGGRDNTESCCSGRLKSCSTHRCAVKPLEARGIEHGPASQAGWVTVYLRDRDHHKCHITWKMMCVCIDSVCGGGCKKKKQHHINIMNYVLIQPLHILPEVAVMNRCTSQVLIITVSVKIVQIRRPAPTCRWMLITQSCCQWLTSPLFDLAKWPH